MNSVSGINKEKGKDISGFGSIFKKSNITMKDSDIKKHAIILMCCCSGLYSVSFFQRVAVPGTIFNELQKDFAASASTVTTLGSIYLLVYASLQLFIGMLADRHGGVKITLVCGFFLCVGSVLFPLSGNQIHIYFYGNAGLRSHIGGFIVAQ